MLPNLAALYILCPSEKLVTRQMSHIRQWPLSVLLDYKLTGSCSYSEFYRVHGLVHSPNIPHLSVIDFTFHRSG